MHRFNENSAVLYYVHRTLQVLDGLPLDEEAYRIIEKVLTYSELAKGRIFKTAGAMEEKTGLIYSYITRVLLISLVIFSLLNV
ncbi:hypothetical protein ACT7CZ_15265 [Bacillus cereus]